MGNRMDVTAERVTRRPPTRAFREAPPWVSVHVPSKDAMGNISPAGSAESTTCDGGSTANRRSCSKAARRFSPHVPCRDARPFTSAAASAISITSGGTSMVTHRSCSTWASKEAMCPHMGRFTTESAGIAAKRPIIYASSAGNRLPIGHTTIPTQKSYSAMTTSPIHPTPVDTDRCAFPATRSTTWSITGPEVVA